MQEYAGSDGKVTKYNDHFLGLRLTQSNGNI